MPLLSLLSNDALLRDLHALAASHRTVTLALILHLSEVDARRLHVEKGFSSLFAYCVAALGFSEDEACRRIEAARLARSFPAICPLLASGALSLSVLGLLKPHLTVDNHQELLSGVSGSSVRRAREWLAAAFPLPDVPSTIRKLPTPSREGASLLATRPAVAPVTPGGLEETTSTTIREPCSEAASSLPGLLGSPVSLHALLAPGASLGSSVSVSLHALPAPPGASLGSSAPSLDPRRPPPASSRVLVEPLSRDRFLVKFTAGRAMKEKLESARDLMSHANPRGELSVVLERALDLLILELETKKQGRTAGPRTGARPATGSQRDSRGASRGRGAQRLAVFVRGRKRAAL